MAELLNFTGGLQTTTSIFLRKADQLEHSINVHGDNIGTVTKRLGYTQHGDTLDSNQTIRGLHEYNDISGGTRRLFAYVNTDLMYDNSGTWTDISGAGGLDADAEIEMRTYLDQLFIVGADSSNNYITTANVDGTTYSTATNVTDAPKARYVEVYKGQLFLADVDVSGTRHPSRVYYSSVPNSAGTTITWPDTNYEAFDPDNGEAITGLHSNKSLDVLLIFKENSLHTFDLTRVRNVGNVGTNSHRSIETINFITFWFKAGQGIYAYSGIQPQLISRPIEKWIYGIDSPTGRQIVAAKENERIYKLYVGDITVPSDDEPGQTTTYTNCEIRYSVPDNTFTIYSYANNFTIYATHTDSSGDTHVYTGATDGKTYKLAKNNEAVYSDAGTDIAAEFMTKAIDMKQPSMKKYVDKTVVYSTNPQNLQMRSRVRNKEWNSFRTIDSDEFYYNLNTNNGRFHQFHFSEKSSSAPFKFEGLSFDPIAISQYHK